MVGVAGRAGMGSVEEGHCRPEAGLVEGEQPRHNLGLGEEQPPSFEDMGIPLVSQTVTTPLGKVCFERALFFVVSGTNVCFFFFFSSLCYFQISLC